MVILQGWGTSLSGYDYISSCISPPFRVLQFDLPGFGSSDEPPESWGVEDYTVFFIHFMEKMGIRRCRLIGHSYGGRVIIRLLGTQGRILPFEVESVVLIDAAGIKPVRTKEQERRIIRYKMIKKFVELPPGKALFGEMVE